MKKTLFTLVLMATAIIGHSQMSWIIDQDIAKNVAMQENKFIVMDFWATWCGPCKLMDREMWMSSDINEVSDKFIPLKVDVDRNNSLAMKYGARSIPLVVVVDPMGNKIWQQVGYSTKDPFFYTFENLPNCNLPQEAVQLEINEEGNPESWMAIGLAYQKMGKDQKHNKLQLGMLALSDEYLKKVIKKSSDEKAVHVASLNQVLNDAYRGRSKNALKRLAKMDGDNSDLENYIQAYCYKCMGDNAEMEKYKKKIKSEELLAQLQ